MDDYIRSQLIEAGLNESHILILEENEIDTQEFCTLTMPELLYIFPNKLGIVRKIIRVIQNLYCTNDSAGEEYTTYQQQQHGQIHGYNNNNNEPCDCCNKRNLFPPGGGSTTQIIQNPYHHHHHHHHSGQMSTSLPDSTSISISEEIPLEDELLLQIVDPDIIVESSLLQELDYDPLPPRKQQKEKIQELLQEEEEESKLCTSSSNKSHPIEISILDATTSCHQNNIDEDISCHDSRQGRPIDTCIHANEIPLDVTVVLDSNQEGTCQSSDSNQQLLQMTFSEIFKTDTDLNNIPVPVPVPQESCDSEQKISLDGTTMSSDPILWSTQVENETTSTSNFISSPAAADAQDLLNLDKEKIEEENKKKTIFLLKDLPTTRYVKISKGEHRVIQNEMKSSNTLLNDLVKSMSIKCIMPKIGSKSNQIKIEGLPDQTKQATNDIRRIINEFSSIYTKKMIIDRDINLYICGPNGNKLKELEKLTNTKIITTIFKKNVEILIQGNTEMDVTTVLEILEKNLEESKTFVKKSIEIEKSYQRYVVGHKRQNILQVLSQTGVVVQVPPNEDTISNTITLWGPSEKIDQAVELVIGYSQSHSKHSKDKIQLKQELQKYLLHNNDQNGGSPIIEQIQKNSNVQIEFPKMSDMDKNTITIEGTIEGVKQVKKQLQDMNRIKIVKMDMDTKYYRFFCRNDEKLCHEIENYFNKNLKIIFPRYGQDNNTTTSQVTLKGLPHIIQLGKIRLLKEIDEIDKKLKMDEERNNMKQKKQQQQRQPSKEEDNMNNNNSIPSEEFVKINRTVYSRLIGVNGKEISKIEKQYGVHVQFPKPTDALPNVISICGPNEQNVLQVKQLLIHLENKYMSNNIK